MDFYIDEAYLTDIIVRTEYLRYENRSELTADELLEAIKNPVAMTSLSNKDHPEFTYLREHLEQQGFIAVQRGWWNGDCVLKSFRLNDVKFHKGEKFPCASAMKGHLKFVKLYNQKKKGGQNA